MLKILLRAAGAVALLLSTPPVHSQGTATKGGQAGVLPAVARGPAAAVDAFHAALKRGDTRAALLLLTDDALIFEAGRVERGKAEYASHHLSADSEFSKAVPSRLVRRSGGASDALAWIASEGRTTGTFRGKAVDRVTVETMLLRRVGKSWKIAHIHWSSTPAPAPAVMTATTDAPLLARSVPASGAVVRGPVNRLELHFSPPARLLEVIIDGPDGQMPMMVTAVDETAHYSLPLPGLGAGAYAVNYRASTGGRDDRGTFRFTVR